MEKNDTILAIVGTIIIGLMIALLFWQQNTIKEYKELLEKTDTTTVETVDTLYLEKTYTDSVPKYINQTIYKTDTVYQKEGDSISATPMVITLKKKITPIQLFRTEIQ